MYSDERAAMYDPESRIFDISDTRFVGVLRVPAWTEQFYCRDCGLTKLPELPGSLLVLDCRGNNFDEFPELPVGLKELWIAGARWGQKLCEGLPEELEVLVWENGPISCVVDKLPRTLRVLEIWGHEERDVPIDFAKLPEGLTYFSISQKGARGFGKLPEGLIYFSDGEAEELPELPEGLEVLSVGGDHGEIVIRKLPESLKILDIAYCSIRLECELPRGLVRLLACDVRGVKSWNFPDELEEIDISSAGARGVLEIPNKVARLNCSCNEITEIVWRGGVVPPLLDFNCSANPIRAVPPLPSVMRRISISDCGGLGAWRGNFSRVEILNCARSGLTELPDIAEAIDFYYSQNRLRWLPECAVKARGWARGVGNGNLFGEREVAELRESVVVDPVGSADPVAGTTEVIKWGGAPSLLELAGIAVVEHGLRGAVELAELREYLDGFGRCVGCDRAAPLHRRWDFSGRAPVTSVRCWQCPGFVPIPYERFDPLRMLHDGEYLMKLTVAGKYRGGSE
jgi:hypothetical protein